MVSKPTASRWDLLELLMTALVIALVIVAAAATLFAFVFKPDLEQYEFTREEIERLRVRTEWLSLASESATQRTISLLARTHALKPPPGTNPQQFALASAQRQLIRSPKCLKSKKLSRRKWPRVKGKLAILFAALPWAWLSAIYQTESMLWRKSS